MHIVAYSVYMVLHSMSTADVCLPVVHSTLKDVQGEYLPAWGNELRFC